MQILNRSSGRYYLKNLLQKLFDLSLLEALLHILFWTCFNIKHVVKPGEYVWIQTAVFVQWHPQENRQLVFFLNLPLIVTKYLTAHRPAPDQRGNPYIWHALFAQGVVEEYDKSIWSLRVLVRPIEKVPRPSQAKGVPGMYIPQRLLSSAPTAMGNWLVSSSDNYVKLGAEDDRQILDRLSKTPHFQGFLKTLILRPWETRLDRHLELLRFWSIPANLKAVGLLSHSIIHLPAGVDRPWNGIVQQFHVFLASVALFATVLATVSAETAAENRLAYKENAEEMEPWVGTSQVTTASLSIDKTYSKVEGKGMGGAVNFYALRFNSMGLKRLP
ncbi:hypothetical protein CNMCM5623_006236 [Aspergillus felis]|uniref:Uncharacterized protein n=1 Tax=Aspergillus felis TaxID=1287682 RepID=A0A8H6QK48_9EURO|nr:hypothetical protein CNMCM5623_006236 [Aspergillus felis]